MTTLGEALQQALNEMMQKKAVFELRDTEPEDLGFITITKKYCKSEKKI